MDETPPVERKGDEARLEMLFHRHYRDVAAYVRRRAEPDLVDDVVAETFLVAWRRLGEVPVEALAQTNASLTKAAQTDAQGRVRVCVLSFLQK